MGSIYEAIARFAELIAVVGICVAPVVWAIWIGCALERIADALEKSAPEAPDDGGDDGA